MDDLRFMLTRVVDELDRDDIANTIADALEGLVSDEAASIISERLHPLVRAQSLLNDYHASLS